MKLTATQAKERILSGKIEGSHEVMEDLYMRGCIIQQWPNWKFRGVDLSNANISKISGTLKFLKCSRSTLQEIDPLLQVLKDSDGFSADFSECRSLKKAQGNFLGCTRWNDSGIVKIDPNTRFGIDVYGHSAHFVDCKHLVIALGNFQGSTNWAGSAITKIATATKLGIDHAGFSANFSECTHLHPVTYATKPAGNVSGNITFVPRAPTLPAMDF